MSNEFSEITIENMRSKVKQHRDLFESNEAAVSQSLVLPTLKALGWNTDNPDEVFPQYAYAKGVEFDLLSNGVQWVLMRSFEKRRGIQERMVWEITIEADSVKKITRNLRTIAKGNIDKLDELIKKMNAFEDKWKYLLEKKELLAVTLSELLLRELSRTMPDIELELDEIKDFIVEKIKCFHSDELTEWTGETVKPPLKGIRIGADSISCEHSYDILVQTAEWIIKHGRLKPNEVPVEAGHKRFLVNREKNISQEKISQCPESYRTVFG